MQEMNLEEFLETEASSEAEGFRIDSDDKAEWALRKIRELESERNRLNEVCVRQAQYYTRKSNDLTKNYNNRIGHFRAMLLTYFDTVEKQTTKSGTQIYRLPSGKLVRKVQQPSFDLDEPALVDWLDANGLTDYVKVSRSPRWGDLKRVLAVSEAGAVYPDTGEVVPGVRVTPREPKFEVEV